MNKPGFSSSASLFPASRGKERRTKMIIRPAVPAALIAFIALAFPHALSEEEAADEPRPVSMHSDIPPRGFVAFRLDGKTGRLIPEPGNPYSGDAFKCPAGTLEKAPAWIRPDLERALAGLRREPLVWEQDAWPLVADANGDGLPDLILHSPAKGSIRCLLAPGFEESAVLSGIRLEPGGHIAFLDLTGDGRPDLLHVGRNGEWKRFAGFDAPWESSNVELPPGFASDFTGGCSFLTGGEMESDRPGEALLVAGFADGSVREYRFSKGKPAGSPRQFDVVFPGAGNARIAGAAAAGLPSGGLARYIGWSDGGSLIAFGFGDRTPASSACFEGFGLHPGSRAAMGDLTGDGLPDLVEVRSDGSVFLAENEGSRGNPWFPRGELEAPIRFPLDPGCLSRPAFCDVDGDGMSDLIAGTKEGRLAVLRGPEFKTPPESGAARKLALLEFKGCAAPASCDLNRDGIPDIVVGEETGGLRFFLSKEFAEVTVDGVGQGSAEFPAPAFADLDRDGIEDLVVGRADGSLRVYRGVKGGSGKPAFTSWSGHPLEGKSFGKSANPALGDIDGDGNADAVIGNQDGRIAVLIGPDWKEDQTWLLEADLGEMAAPALADLDGDGKPDLAAGCVAGRVSFYRNKGSSFEEAGSWAFKPDHEFPDLRAYLSRHYPQSRPFLAATDRESAERILDVLSGCGKEIIDEAAFSIAHTPVEVIRTMARLGNADLFRANAACIYDVAKKLKYARLVEEGDRTTIEYSRADGTKERLPFDAYYWWVVHPRILYEIPSRIDSSWWKSTPASRGLSEEAWLKHEPERSVYETAPESSFWRNRLPDDASGGKTLMAAAMEATNLEAAMTAVHGFITSGKPGGRMKFGYLTSDIQPLVIFEKRYGSCGEHSIVAAACGRAMLIPVSVVTDRGEDHQWNEFWMGGAWHHWDICNGEGIDDPGISTEGERHKGKTVTAVLRWRGDDVQESATTSVFNPKDKPYTASGSGYTDTARVTVKAVDAAGSAVDGALVIFRSHWDNRNAIGHWGYTGIDGTISFDVGYQPNGGYTIEVLSAAGCAGIRNYPVVEGKAFETSIALPGKLPARAPAIDFATGPQRGRHVSVSLRESAAFLKPANILTGVKPLKQDEAAKAFVFRKTGFRGTTGSFLPIEGNPPLRALFMDRQAFLLLRRGEASEPLQAAGLNPGRSVEGFLRDDAVLVIFNPCHRAWARCAIDASTFFPARDPVLELAGAGSLSVASGAAIAIEGRATDEAGISSLEWSVDGGTAWIDASDALAGGGAFSIDWTAGIGGPLPPGVYTVLLRARDFSGRTALKEIRINVLPSTSFTSQRIRQDNTESPLPACSWVLGPFEIPERERFIEISAKGTAEGFDMDMFLFHDRNGNGTLDGMDEKITASTSPSASERIYLDSPPHGIYWLYCQGWQVKQAFALLDVRISFVPRHKIVADFRPSGFIREAPGEIACTVKAPSGIRPGSVKVTVDGAPAEFAIENGRLSVRKPVPVPEGKEIRVEVSAADLAGNADVSSWIFEVDRNAPSVAIKSPAQDSVLSGKVEVKAQVSDDRKLGPIILSIDNGNPMVMGKSSNEEGICAVSVDVSGLAPGMHVLKVEAADAAGNKAAAELKFEVKAAPEKKE